MKPATAPRGVKDMRVLVVDGVSGAMRVVSSLAIATLFEPGDLLVVNDAATLPASLAAKTDLGEDVELRLVTSIGDRARARAERSGGSAVGAHEVRSHARATEGSAWTALLLGSGDYHTRTEDRPAPPPLGVGDRLYASHRIVARVTKIHPASPRLVDVELSLGIAAFETSLGELWSALYRAGRPVQYAHVPEPLALWDIQNVYAARPWAVEMPSAGRILRVETLLELQKRGVEIAKVTHAAGLSSIGDPTLDKLLPFPERYEVTEATWEALALARKRGGRVIAIGTSAARALEGGARAGRTSGITDLKMGAETRRAIVDAVLTGVHEADTSHFALLRSFASEDVLARALKRAETEGLLGHELGDACLVWGEPRDQKRAAAAVAPRSLVQALAAPGSSSASSGESASSSRSRPQRGAPVSSY